MDNGGASAKKKTPPALLYEEGVRDLGEPENSTDALMALEVAVVARW